MRPFAAECDSRIRLQNIHIGRDAAVGLKSVVAPGTVIKPSTCIGPNSSSWEMDDATEMNREALASSVPKLHWLCDLLISSPVAFLLSFVSHLPYLMCLLAVVQRYRNSGAPDMLKETIFWFASANRIGYLVMARACQTVAGPLFRFLGILLVKRILDWICGRPRVGSGDRTTRQKIRSAVLTRMKPNANLKDLSRLLGRHYELMSIIMRLLGARIGKRVYWPGTGPSINDFDLLEVGDDVVFGSRSHLVTQDGYGRDRIVIESGAMIADRVVALPGAVIREGCMIGSGSLLRRNGEYPANSVWLGSRGGDAVFLPSAKGGPQENDHHSRPPGSLSHDSEGVSIDTSRSITEKSTTEKDTRKPFGRAFYDKQASYYVLGLTEVVAYSIVIAVLANVFWLLRILVGLIIIKRALINHEHQTPAGWSNVTGPLGPQFAARPVIIWGVFTACVSMLTLLLTVIAVQLVVVAKWLVIGRREPGSFHWDKSSYNQRWQFMLTVESFVRKAFGPNGEILLTMFSGTAYMRWYYCALGARIGPDCALHANGSPSLMLTEPDLVQMGERVAVDDASVVCHLNSRGLFELHELKIGARSALRTGSRLMSGASMGEQARLLEHTLVLPGQMVDDNETVQGWPS